MKLLTAGKFFVLTILIFSTFPNISDSKLDHRIEYSIKTNQTSSENSLSNVPKQITIFFHKSTEFETFSRSHNIIRSYPHLKAVKVSLSESDLSKYADLSIEVYPAELFNYFQTTGQPQGSSTEIKSQHEGGTNSVANLTSIENLWELGYNGSGINVAIIDNGINGDHPALQGKIVETYDISTNGTTPCKDHGTAVAGSLAASADPFDNHTAGTGFGAKLFDISMGCKGVVVSGDILDGFEYILSNGSIDVVNTSFGGFAPAWDFIVEQLESAGIMVVGSAGNAGPASHTTTTGGPGNSLNGISVGSIGFDGFLSSFSAIGPAHNMLIKPDVLAPGEDINTTSVDGGYSQWFGTSFSSPIVAGGLATILSALNQNTIPWNSGLIKAALMRSATWYENGELASGQGLVNFTRMWELVTSLIPGGDSVPQIVELTPKMGPIPYLQTVPQGVIAGIPLTLISSHPNDVSFSFTGDLDGISSVSPVVSTYSQLISLNINTTSLSSDTVIMGNLTALLGSDYVTVELEITIGATVHSRIGMDLGHTYFNQFGQNGIGSRNNGEFVKLAMRNGFWVEQLYGEINATILSNYDILWMPDPVNLIYANFEPLADLGFMENPLLNLEIDSIESFVVNGGSLLVNSMGYRNDSDSTGELKLGLNVSRINELTSRFGISYATEPILDPIGSVTIDLLNESSVVGDAKRMTHFGNYLHIQDPAHAVAKTNGGLISTALYNDPNGGGRVIVSSSDVWFDNAGILGGYIGAGQNNKKLALNVLNWLVSDIHVIKTSEIISNGVLTGSFKVIENASISAKIPNVYIYDEINEIRTELTPTSLGFGEYGISYTLPSDAKFRVVAEVDDDYVAWVVIVDVIPPTIFISSENPNGTVLPIESIHTLSFILSDDSSGIDEDSLAVSIDGLALSVGLISFNDNTGSLRVIFRDSDLPHSPNGTYYLLHIEIGDKVGNLATLDYYFGVGEIIIQGPSSSGSLTSSNTSGGDGSGFNLDLGTSINIIASIIIIGFIGNLIVHKVKKSPKN